MKKILLLASSLLLFTTLRAEVLLVEDFDYSIGSTLSSCTGWLTNYGGESQTTVSNGLEFCGYAGSGIGNGALSSGKDSSAQPQKKFDTQSSGDIYVAFMLNPKIATKCGYFLFLRDSVNISDFNDMDGCVLLDTSYHIGLSFNSGTTDAIYSKRVLDSETTYLVVLKYSIVAGTKNDVVSLYVLTSMLDNEPTTPLLTIANTSDGKNHDINPGVVGLRSYGNDEWINIDGIRVATTWAEAVAYNSETDCPQETALTNTTIKATEFTTSKNALHLTLNADNTVAIYDLTGKCIYRDFLTMGKYNFTLQSGFYIIRTASESHKFVVK